MSIEFKVNAEPATQEVGRVHAELASSESRTDLMKAIGRVAEGEIINWFKRREADSPNKMGWPRQHFWARLARATAYVPSATTETNATVAVADPALAAKIFGATIRPTSVPSPLTGKPRKFIAIPLQGEVYGKPPSGQPVPGLFFIRSKSGIGGFLVTSEGKKDLKFWYRLKPEVTVPKDPQALPPIDALGAVLSETATSFFRRHGGPN